MLEINSELEIPDVTSFPTVKTTLTGASIAPTIPVPNPLKNPPTPPFLDCSTGFVTIPVTPCAISPIPFLNPLKAPLNKPLGFSSYFTTISLSVPIDDKFLVA